MAGSLGEPSRTNETCIEHSYPEAFRFLEQHSPDTIAILHELITHATELEGALTVEASIRQIAERLPLLSKDTVHRRLRELHRSQVIRLLTTTASRHRRPIYALDLTGTGISVKRSTTASA